MEPFPASNVWRASVVVITLLIQGHSLLASQNECVKNDQEVCMYECNASELQKFSCGEYTNTSYIPPESHPFCCPGYFKTASGKCQKCNDVEFMPKLNKCCGCILCKECDARKNDTVKEDCTRENNTVCWIEPDPAPCPGLRCPSELPTTTSPQEIQTTGTNHSNNSSNGPDARKSNTEYTNDFFVLLVFCIIFAMVVVLVFCLCFYLIWLGANTNVDQVDGSDTWKNALIPLARKLRGQPGRQPVGRSESQSESQSVSRSESQSESQSESPPERQPESQPESNAEDQPKDQPEDQQGDQPGGQPGQLGGQPGGQGGQQGGLSENQHELNRETSGQDETDVTVNSPLMPEERRNGHQEPIETTDLLVTNQQAAYSTRR